LERKDMGLGKKSGKNKKGFIVILILLIPVLAYASHEFSIRYFQDKTCVACHEMQSPIDKWKASGTAKNHNNCAGCHFDAGFKGWMDMNKSAIRLLIAHFNRDPKEPISTKKEPLFLDPSKEPGYWSHVPNSRCLNCKNAKNHQESDQLKIHSKLIKGISSQPCKDCHNHEMRNGQKFFEKCTEGVCIVPSS
jgi:nitrate/TMAO reductase-like tetraheme cytochrome c subunit